MPFTLRTALVTCVLSCLLLVSANGERQQTPRAIHKTPSAPSEQDRLDINSATLDQLLKVPGMTRTWAARIIRFRPYRAKNDLIDRGIVTNEVYSRIKDYIIAHRATQ